MSFFSVEDMLKISVLSKRTLASMRSSSFLRKQTKREFRSNDGLDYFRKKNLLRVDEEQLSLHRQQALIVARIKERQSQFFYLWLLLLLACTVVLQPLILIICEDVIDHQFKSSLVLLPTTLCWIALPCFAASLLCSVRSALKEVRGLP